MFATVSFVDLLPFLASTWSSEPCRNYSPSYFHGGFLFSPPGKALHACVFLGISCSTTRQQHVFCAVRFLGDPT
uniref:Secreted protein n=1 Tax=Arundo donax TaxID=35708 RepID=A0A0A9BTH6_ARUDO